MRVAIAMMLGLAVMMNGCQDETAPRDVVPPAPPRGVFSTTGDGTVLLRWVANTESDLAGYRVYESDCAGGGGCPYLSVGFTGATSYVVGPLPNGVTQYFAVSAVDRAGNESELSDGYVMDTPRPAGSNLPLTEANAAPATAGYDFSSYAVLPAGDLNTDIYYALVGGVPLMVCPFTDTDIQDAGYATSLDAVDWAPLAGWASSGTAELIPGHCYVVRIAPTDIHYAKFRVTSLTSGLVVLDWAYQIAPNNQELRARPSTGVTRVRRAGLDAVGAPAASNLGSPASAGSFARLIGVTGAATAGRVTQ